jgi:hypothetical protein
MDNNIGIFDQTFVISNIVDYITLSISVLARQSSRAADSLLRSSQGGGEWGPPLCIGKQAVGTYIYSLAYTHTGLLGQLL